MPSRDLFTTVRTEGGLLPADFLQRVASGDRSLDGLTPESYHLAENERINEATNRAWNRLVGAWAGFKTARDKLEAGDLGTTATRERWLLVLFQELGYGRLVGAKAVEIGDKSYPISHFWNHTPIHLVGCNVELDRRTKGVKGAAGASPHGLVQEFLNRSDECLWGIASNGLCLRLLRDNVSLTRQAYLEFDLEAMMEGETYSDFVLLWLLCHQSRVEADKPEECWLERWCAAAREQGTRALDRLRVGVESAIEALGRGFMAHPKNSDLREELRAGTLDKQDYYRQLLRLVYRLLFLFVAEDRGLLLDPSATRAATERYWRYYSTVRLRRLAQRRRGSAHADLYHGLRVVMQKLGTDTGCETLGLPALGSFLWSHTALPDLETAEIPNADFLDAMRSLAFTIDGKILRAIDYKNLAAEELGSIYESLLELHPDITAEPATFKLTTAGGHERKTTGSYYTPESVVQCLLDSALNPVLDEASKQPDPEKVILALKICDPACGSGHFLIAAAHRIAKILAAVRTGENESSPEAIRSAFRDVIGHCLYGVDLNPMAVELCKVSLWIEALERGKPLSFLDHRIQHGNSLLGTTPALIEKGIPDDAFQPIEGDDKEVVKSLRKRNKQEREGQMTILLDYVADARRRYATLSDTVVGLDVIRDDWIANIHQKENRYHRLTNSPDYRRAALLADAWCASFMWRKTRDAPPMTHDVFRQLQSNPERVPVAVRGEVEQLAMQHRLFHWHLAFPNVFRLPQNGEKAENEAAGWSGGFDLVLGNPPWEAEELIEKEFFAASLPEISSVRTKAKRSRLIGSLEQTNPEAFAAWITERRQFDGRVSFCRNSARFPLGSAGKLNTYRLFAELASDLAHRAGRSGQVLKSGIVTAQDSQSLFSAWMKSCRVVSAYDFINTKQIFPAVVSNERFCLLTLSGVDRSVTSARYAFTLDAVEQVHDLERSFEVASEDLALINPIDHSVPPASSRRDYTLLLKIHGAAPVIRLDDDSCNPWNLHYAQGHLNSASASSLFADLTFEQLQNRGASLEAQEQFRLDGERYIPLYEGKYIAQLNHRFGTFEHVPVSRRFGVKAEAIATTQDQLRNPEYEIRPRYWLSAVEADCLYIARHTSFPWLFVFRDVCRAIVDARTVQACVMPRRPCLDGVPIFVFAGSPLSASRIGLYFSSIWSSFVFDYAARQKIHGAHLTKAIAYQLPLPGRDRLANGFVGCTFEAFLAPRSLELTVVSDSLLPFARDCGYEGAPFRWDEERRFLLRGELDAAFFHLYGIERDDVAHIMETFSIVKRKDIGKHGDYRTKLVILDIYDRMQRAIETGEPYQTLLDPPPADPRVAHPPREVETTVDRG